MNISQFNVLTADRNSQSGFQMKPKIVCNDGFSMSVQGSSGHYCSPRELQEDYYEMEIGYPSEREELLMQWCEDEESPTKTVYAYVPCSVIDEVIEKHGSINKELTFVGKWSHLLNA